MEVTVLEDSPCHKSAKTHLTRQLMMYYEALEDFDGGRLQHIRNVCLSIVLIQQDEPSAEIRALLFGVGSERSQF